MAKNNHSILNLHYGKHAVAHCDLNSGNDLKSLWIEIPGHCHLCCSYCMASTKKNQFNPDENHLTKETYKKLIEDFAKEGGKFIGIPGLGEPFHQKNIDLVKDIILWAQELNLKTTIFTTGDTLFFPPSNIDNGKNGLNSEQEPNYDLINFLIDKDVVLLIKYNTQDSTKQDAIVNTMNYTVLREKAIELLLKRKEENKEMWKLDLGIVTSILPDNSDEIEDLYEKFHNQKGFIFDCDTILPRGKGKKYHDDNYDSKLTQKKISEVFLKLKEKGATLTCQGGTYVGVACDRIKHHLYVSLTGDVYPCIGCFDNPSFSYKDGKSPFWLGNIKEKSLLDCWNHPLRKKLRCNTKEIFDGVCLRCQNFKDETCYSCLGRYTKEIKEIANNDIIIETRGCTLHRPILIPWINKSVDYLRTILAFANTKKLLENQDKKGLGLESLWSDYQNLSQIEQKHKKYSDLFFPLNKAWDFIKVPSNNETELSKKFLPNIFLPSLKILLENHYAENKSSVICNLMFYDNIKNQYFYRTISKGENAESKTEFDKSLILFRWAENFKEGNYFGEKSKGVFFNVSEVFRNSLYREYEFILKENEHIETNGNIFDLSCFFKDSDDTKFITQKIELLNTHIQSKLDSDTWNHIKDLLNKKIFSELEIKEAHTLSTFFEELNDKLYPIKDNTEVVNSISTNILNCIKSFIILNKNKEKEIKQSEIDNLSNISDIQSFVKNEENKKSLGVSINFLNLFSGDNFISTINYLIFLGYLHKYLQINYYLLEHSKSFKTKEETSTLGYEDIIDPSGILICSENRINRDFRSELILLISNVFQPIDEFYFDKTIRQGDENQQKTNVYNHTIKDIAPYLEINFEDIDSFIEKEIFGSSLNLDKEKKLKDLKKKGNDIFNIFHTLLENNLDFEKNRLRGKSLYDLINIVTAYCNHFRDENKQIKNIKPEYDCLGRIDVVGKELDVFILFYNLLTNANKFSFFKNEVQLSAKNIIANEEVEIKIVNDGVLLSNEIEKFVNDKGKIPYGKRFSGLGIAKHFVRSLKWKISTNNLISDKIEDQNIDIADKKISFGKVVITITIPNKK